ncbi:hypothetical protein HGRIS_006208 [Hohenbuehelia grisea]|uniref:FHA domain-containing protein n=1 Tax=Hohenbuehelia grisea TaxID=104357 RepID=A0ABR3K0U2_9AGAR
MARESHSPPPHRARYADDRRDNRGESSRSRYGYGERDRERERARDRDRYDERTRDRDYRRDRERESERGSGPRDSRRDGGERERSRRSESPRAGRSAPTHPPHGSRSRSGSPAPVDKAKPNFAPSGLLAAATNTVQGADGTKTVLKYNEPPEARKPALGWRLYVFKGSEQVEMLHIHRQSAYLAGRDRLVADIPLEHPSCSKQHAVIQYRSVQEKNEYGEVKSSIKPFVIDLESTNGTHVNDNTVPTSRYYELKAGDVIKFGTSAREYVLLHDEAS